MKCGKDYVKSHNKKKELFQRLKGQWKPIKGTGCENDYLKSYFTFVEVQKAQEFGVIRSKMFYFSSQIIHP